MIRVEIFCKQRGCTLRLSWPPPLSASQAAHLRRSLDAVAPLHECFEIAAGMMRRGDPTAIHAEAGEDDWVITNSLSAADFGRLDTGASQLRKLLA